MAGILGFGYLFRQASPIGLLTWTGLFGLYLILTPTIGVSVQQGSLIGQIFRFSPFQVVENGYATLLGGGTLSLNATLILALISSLAAILNLFVYHRKGDVFDEEVNEGDQPSDDQ